jgi:hypothetical protein
LNFEAQFMTFARNHDPATKVRDRLGVNEKEHLKAPVQTAVTGAKPTSSRCCLIDCLAR